MPFDGTEFISQTMPLSPGAPAESRTSGWLSAFFSPRPRSRRSFRSTPEDVNATSLRILVDARALIARRERWVQGVYEAFGRYCAVAALHASCKGQDDSAGLILAHAFLREVAMQRGFSRVESLNDRSPHAAVLTAFDEAIATAQRRAKAAA
jgi:hypothetical protein